MRKIQVLTDSCSDLSGELLERYGIDYCRMRTVRDGVETPASLTWEYYSPKELYDIMRGGERILTTQVPMEEFQTVFEKYLKEGCDIIYVGCSLKQSSSVNTATVLSKKLLEAHPEARIACIDSSNASMGEGALAILAAELVGEGKDFDTVVDTVIASRKRLNQFVTVHSLEYLRRAGRVKGSAAFFGNLMGVKPILIADADGEQTPIKKVKGRAKSLSEMVAMLKETLIDPEGQTIYVAHADAPTEDVEAICEEIRRRIPCRDVVTVYIGSIIGASIGPDAIGIWGFGQEVTYRVGEGK